MKPILLVFLFLGPIQTILSQEKSKEDIINWISHQIRNNSYSYEINWESDGGIISDDIKKKVVTTHVIKNGKIVIVKTETHKLKSKPGFWSKFTTEYIIDFNNICGVKNYCDDLSADMKQNDCTELIELVLKSPIVVEEIFTSSNDHYKIKKMDIVEIDIEFKKTMKSLLDVDYVKLL